MPLPNPRLLLPWPSAWAAAHRSNENRCGQARQQKRTALGRTEVDQDVG
jgi:hypothetical protein